MWLRNQKISDRLKIVLTPKSKHDTSTGSWDAETGCWVMECNAEIWESDFRFQGVFENRKKIEEGCFFEEEAKEDSDLSVSP